MRELLAMIDAAEDAMEAAARRRDVLMLCADFAARLEAAGVAAFVGVTCFDGQETVRLVVPLGAGTAPEAAGVNGVELTAPAPDPRSALVVVPKAAHHAAAPADGLKSGPFSPAEVGAIRLGLQAGRSARELAADIGRSVHGVGAVIGKLKRDGTVYSAPVVKESLTVATVQVLPPAAPPFREQPPTPEEVIRTRLSRIGHTQEWCLDCDAQLLEALSRGVKLKAYAAQEKVTPSWLTDRYRKLVPDASYQGQLDVARIARAMAAEAGR